MATGTIHIPETLEALKEGLGGLDRLLTAKEWERAAIVYAWTREGVRGEGGPGRKQKDVSTLLVDEFAALNIKGLLNKPQVVAYRAAWKKGGGRLNIQPGDDVTLPKGDWKASFTSDPRDKATKVITSAYLGAHPEVITETIKDFPDLADYIAQMVVDSEDLSRRVFAKRVGIHSFDPADRVAIKADYDETVARGFNLINEGLSAEAEGKWTPSGTSETALRLLSISLNERSAGTPSTVHDDIREFLATAK